jgi:pimeloyl-ACP methyl ester carboxylesterase
VPTLLANDIRLHVRELGPRGAPALLLVQGLGMQVTDWPRALLRRLAQRNHLILFDNRDYGRSQLCGPAIDPALRAADYPFAPVAPERTSYALSDMAQDALGVLDALGIARAHLLGFSLGGMIAQMVAALHPDRVLSLTSLMSSGGQAALPPDVPAARELARMIVHVSDRRHRLARALAAAQIWAGPYCPIDRVRAARHLDLNDRRCYRPAAVHRQALAYASAGERSLLLRCIACPTLILHGDADPVIPLSFARRAHELIPRSRFMVLPGAAHDLGALDAAGIASLVGSVTTAGPPSRALYVGV